MGSRAWRGAHLEAGGWSGARRSRGAGEGVVVAGSRGRVPRRLLPAGRAERDRASCRLGCRRRTDRVGEWERGPKPSPRK